MTAGHADRIVTVAVVTFRRTDDLAELMPLLVEQVRQLPRGTSGRLLVVDNDPAESARAVIAAVDGPVRYEGEPHPGIAAARNRALISADDAAALVFIDDDERPAPGWLAALVDRWAVSGAAAVAGAVRTVEPADLDPWIREGGFLRRRHRSGLAPGTELRDAATNNLLVDLDVVRSLGLRFDVEFGLSGGEDTLFTRALCAHNRTIVWEPDAVVSELVRPDRLNRRWFLFRAQTYGSSDVRIALRLASGRGSRFAVRARAVGTGLVRIAYGSLLATLGLLTGRLGRRAWGMQMAYRGVGLVEGACGVQHVRYRRPAPADSTPIPPTTSAGGTRAGEPLEPSAP